MRTEDLIVTLAHESGPWTPLAPVRVRVARWILLAAGLCVVMVAAVGARPDIRLALQSPAYVLLAVATLFSGLVASVSAMTLSVPGAERTRLWRAVAVLLAAAWALALVSRLAAGGDAWPRLVALPNHWACVAEIAGLSLASGWALFVMIHRAAPLQRGWSAGLATLASTALAATATQIMCPIDDPAHHLVSHVAPVLVLVVLGTFAGSRVLRPIGRGFW